MTKVKREKVSDGEEAAAAEAGGPERSYAELVAHLNPIAQPLASRKLSKKLYKCVKKGRKPGKVLHVSASRLSGTGSSSCCLCFFCSREGEEHPAGSQGGPEVHQQRRERVSPRGQRSYKLVAGGC